MRRSELALVVSLLSAGCAPPPGHQNPYDPSSPSDKLAKATIAGTWGVEAIAGPPDLSGTHVSLVGTGLSADTDASGKFSIAGVTPGAYTLTASHAGYDPGALAGINVTLADGESIVSVKPPQLHASRASIHGTLGLEGRANASGILVSLVGTTFTGLTDSSGAFRLSGVPLGNYSLSATLDQYAPLSPQPAVSLTDSGADVTAPAAGLPAGNSTLSLLRTAKVAGSVALQGATTAAGAVAHLAGTDINGVAVTPSDLVIGGSSNSFSFSGLPAGNYSLTLSAPGYDASSVASLRVSASATVDAGLQTLKRSLGVVAGTVALSAGASGLPLGPSDLLGISVQVTDPGLSASFGAVTDAAGNFSIPNVPVTLPSGAAYNITASKPGYLSASASVLVVSGIASGPSSQLTLKVAPSTLSGTVAFAPPAPSAANAQVVAAIDGVAFNGGHFSAATPSFAGPGSWAIANVPAGSYSVTITGSSTYQTASAPLVVPVPSPASATPPSASAGNYVLQRASASFSGTVQPAANGTGLSLGSTNCQTTPSSDCAGIAVYVSHPTQLFATFGALTDSSGRFTISNLPLPSDPTLGYTVIAAKQGYLDSPETGSTILAAGGTALNTISVPARSSTVTACVLVPPAIQGSAPDSVTGVQMLLSGQAFNGTPYSKAATSLVDDATGATCGAAHAGLATFSAVPDGSYSIAITRASYSSSSSPTVNVAGANISSRPLLTTLVRGAGAVSGTVAFSAPTFAPGVTFDVTKARSGAVVTLDGPELGGGHLVATTDASGAFTFTAVPANVSGTYSVKVVQAHFVPVSAGSDTTSVTVVPSTNAIAAGLSLTVNAGTLQSTSVFHDWGCASGLSCSNYNGCSVCQCAGSDQYAGNVSVSVTGTAFTGDPVLPNAQVTAGSGANQGVASFLLPPGTYTVSTGPTGHSAAAAYPDVLEGKTSCSTLTVSDTLYPAAPVIASSRRSPTSATTTNLSLLQPSSDLSVPVNFNPVAGLGTYEVKVCSPTCGATQSWNGAGSLSLSLTNGVDNVIIADGVDAAGNRGPTSSLTVHAENLPPGQVANVRVDNRPGAVRISWDPLASTSSLPIAGYRVYYGPLYSSSLADYNGDSAAQGPSPIDVGSRNELLLTGLPNDASFYAVVMAYDTAVDPAPNQTPMVPLSPFGTGSGTILSKGLPSNVPFDRAVRTYLDPYPNSIASRGNLVFASAGATPPYTIKAYSYDRYGLQQLPTSPSSGLTQLGVVSSSLGKRLVADDNALIFAMDPGQTGIDVIDASNPSSLSVFASNVFAGLKVDHLLPLRRSDVGGAHRSHGVLTYFDPAASAYKIRTFQYSATDHLALGALDNDAINLSIQSAPLRVAAAGRYVFALSNNSNSCVLSVYSIPADFGNTGTSISVVHSSANLSGSSCYAGAGLTVDWPRVYVASANSLFLASAPFTSDPAPIAGISLASFGTSSAVAGNLLLVGEQQGSGQTSFEGFDLTTPTSPALVGHYELTRSYDLDQYATYGGTDDLLVNGSAVYALLRGYQGTTPQGAPGTSLGAVDVVELGSPRVMAKVNLLPKLVNSSADYPVAAIGSGSRAIAEIANSGLYYLADIDLHTSGSATTSANVTGGFASGGNCPTFSGPCLPLTVSGDYAYVAAESAGIHTIRIYDAAQGGLASAGALATLTATSAVTSLAVANDLLFASEDGGNGSSQPPLEVWDLTDKSNPTKLPAVLSSTGTPALGRALSVGVSGRTVVLSSSAGLSLLALPSALAAPTIASSASSAAMNGLFVEPARIWAAGFSNGWQTDLWSFAPGSLATAPALMAATYQSQAGVGFVTRNGPYVLEVPGGSATFNALVGYDATGDLTLPMPLVGSYGLIRPQLSSPFSLTGSLALVPDPGQGLVAVRLY